MNRPRFEERKETMLAYIEHEGPYNDILWGELMAELYRWAKEHKVIPGFHPIGIYFDDPQVVPGYKCRSHIAITFRGEGKAAHGVKIRKLTAMKVGTLSFKGPASELGRAYRLLSEWIAAKGHKAVGPSFEIYSKSPEIVDGTIILYSKIMMSVEPIER